MRNHNNYCEEDDKDKYYSCKNAELIKTDWWLATWKRHWSFYYFKLVDLLESSEKQTECDQFEFLFDSFPPYSLHQIGLRLFTSKLG